MANDQKNTTQDHPFKWFLDKIKTWENHQLLAALTILSKDMAEYLAPGGWSGTGQDVFWKSYLEVLNNDRWFWEQFPEESNLYKPLHTRFSDLPQPGFAAMAAADPSAASLNVDPLNLPELLQTWTLVKGWEFLKKYTNTLSVNVNDLKQKYIQSSNLSFEERVLQIFDQLQQRYQEPYWIPLIMFVSYLLVWSCFVAIVTP
jgi:hypothetical protein